ncbi:MAG: hypothetical protein IK136_03215 [Oscillospiraceae bacterium]|nr:hypothetical protein [Oscillospiraceae bacterium]
MTDLIAKEIRYCSPYHGGWDIARMALAIPESHAVFFCPASCARIIALNAAKNGIKPRLSVYGLREDEIVMNDYRDAVVGSIRELLSRPFVRPKVILIFVSCIDSMLATDHEGELRELRAAYPDITFMLMKMDPICQTAKRRQTIFKLHEDIFSLLEPREKDPRAAAILGGNEWPRDGYFTEHLRKNGVEAMHIGLCKTLSEFRGMSRASVNVCTMPYGTDAVKLLQKRYETPFVHLTQKADLDLFESGMKSVCDALSIPCPDFDALRQEAVSAVERTAKKIGRIPVYVDSAAFMDPVSWGLFLKRNGLNVKKVYVYAPNAAETPDAQTLKSEFPDVEVRDCGRYDMPDGRTTEVCEAVAIGQESGCFAGAKYTVPLFCDNGHWGWDAVLNVCRLIENAPETAVTAAKMAEEAILCAG